jgi:hypothetical protein
VQRTHELVEIKKNAHTFGFVCTGTWFIEVLGYKKERDPLFFISRLRFEKMRLVWVDGAGSVSQSEGLNAESVQEELERLAATGAAAAAAPRMSCLAQGFLHHLARAQHRDSGPPRPINNYTHRDLQFSITQHRIPATLDDVSYQNREMLLVTFS